MRTSTVIGALIVTFLSVVEGWLMSPVRPPAVSTEPQSALAVPGAGEGKVGKSSSTAPLMQTAISYFEARDLKYDIAMGLTEGAGKFSVSFSIRCPSRTHFTQTIHLTNLPPHQSSNFQSWL